MSKFTFGTPTTTAAQQPPSFGFGTQTPASGGFGAGTMFGTTPAAATATAQPAVASATPALNFSFGGTAAATTQAQPQPLGLGLGGATQPAGGGLFSTTSQAPPAQSTATTGLSFGTPAKPGGLTFGTPTTSTTGLTTGGLASGIGGGLGGGLSTGQGLTTGGLTSGGLGLGGTSGLSFGTPATTGGLSFGTAATTGGLTFGTAATTGGLTFGTATTNTLSSGLSFGAASTAGGLSFGASTLTATPAVGTATNLNVTSTPSVLGGLFGAKTATTLGATPASTATVATSRGLGGLDVSVSNKGLAQGNAVPTAAKENLLPAELMQTIDSFKEFVKTQKVLSSDIARGSARPLNRCAEDTASLMEILTTLAGSVQRDRSLADKLKQDTAKALQNAEISQRTHDTPAGLQYENNAPLLFFIELAENFENDLMLFKSQIETTEKHIQTMMTPKTLTPQELTMAMSKLHESLVAVAGRLQGVHLKVQQQKEQYLNFRKYVLKDSTNVFEDIKLDGKSNRSSLGKVTSGPTPFGPGNRSFLSSTALNASQTPSYNNPNPLAWGNVGTTPSSNLTLGSTMKPPTAGLNFNPPTNLTAPLSSTDANSSYQLQKPPVGNKRGKH